MSAAAHDLSEKVLRLCRSCAERKARFRHHGIIKADRDHTLCFECFRAARDRSPAQLLVGVRMAQQLPFPPTLSRTRTLTERETAHRRRMLDHLNRAARTSTT